MLGMTLLGNAIFELQNDIKQIHHDTYFCQFRGYLGYSLCALQNYSYLIQSFYRFLFLLIGKIQYSVDDFSSEFA